MIEPSLPEESDLTTDDHVHFYQDGKLVLTIQNQDEMWNEIETYMASTNLWPDVWWISDHGNAHIMSRRA